MSLTNPTGELPDKSATASGGFAGPFDRPSKVSSFSRLQLLASAPGRLALDRKLSILIVGVASFAMSAAPSLFVRMPQPRVHDEFSYLLAADTFAHGRLTNPTHPMWLHFESMHIIQQPSYASKYPPAQGLMLGLGQAIGGHPILGVWLSTALACAAVCWMLLGWLPPRWALLGGGLAVIHPMVLAWSQSYWGGAVAMAGGALVAGGLRRIVRRPRARHAIVMGAGMAVLANSRPYEGMVLSLLAAAGLLWWMLHAKDLPPGVLLKRIVLPVFLVLALSAALMAVYNLRVTGSALRMPYMVHQAIYAVAPPFVWQQRREEPTYHHKELRDFHAGWELSTYTSQRSMGEFILSCVVKTLVLIMGFFSLVGLAIPVIAMPIVIGRNRWMRFALLACGIFTAALLLETWLHQHYAAPITGLVLVLVLQAMRHLRLWRWKGLPTGRMIVWTSVALCIISSVVWYAGYLRIDAKDFSTDRARIMDELRRDEDSHLVIVRYSPEHSPHDEWVYNGADIDSSKVVWAREMGEANDRGLIEYFKGRRVWLLEPDAETPHLSPYALPLQ
jgi:hypothetical protein